MYKRQVERFNGRISEVLATTRFDAAQSLEDTLSRYVQLYNHHIPQRALGHIAPVQALQDWQEKCPRLFKKKVYNLTGLDTYAYWASTLSGTTTWAMTPWSNWPGRSTASS